MRVDSTLHARVKGLCLSMWHAARTVTAQCNFCYMPSVSLRGRGAGSPCMTQQCSRAVQYAAPGPSRGAAPAVTARSSCLARPSSAHKAGRGTAAPRRCGRRAP
eukprot:6181537-Pleurochrysis_carterae.AAC.3